MLDHSDDPDLLLRKAVISALIQYEIDTENHLGSMTAREMRRSAFSAGVESIVLYINA